MIMGSIFFSLRIHGVVIKNFTLAINLPNATLLYLALELEEKIGEVNSQLYFATND